MSNIRLVTSSAEASSNQVFDIVILAIFACFVVGILWLFFRRRKRVRK
jgi:NADH:ubiquinone oxidoreductase subunit K